MARKLRTDITLPAGTDVTGMEDLIFGGPGIPADQPASAGAPAAPAAPASRGPTMREVTVGGAKYLVPEETAVALEAQQAAFEAQSQALRAEIDGLKKPAAPAAAAPAEDDFDTQLFLNPKATLSKLKDEWKQEIRTEYQVTTAQQKWWSDFYAEHKHLNGSNVIVEAVMRANFDELKALPVNQQGKALADKVDAELARIVKSAPRTEPNAPASRPVESASVVRGGPPAPAVSDEHPSDRVVSISELQRKSRQRRLDARMGRSAS